MFKLVAVAREYGKQRRQKFDNGDVIRVGRQPFDGFAELNSTEIAGSFIQCEGCNNRYRIREEQAGRKLKCKECGSTIVVPHSL